MQQELWRDGNGALNLTVNYHKDRLGALSNPPVEAPNDFDEIVKLI